MLQPPLGSEISLHLPALSDVSLWSLVIKRKLISPGTGVSKLSDFWSVMTVNQLDLTLIAYLKHWASDSLGDGWSCQHLLRLERRGTSRGTRSSINQKDENQGVHFSGQGRPSP